MIILVGGTKGGSGKTTVATNLAVMHSLEKKDVLLVDADDQESAFDFTNLRNQKTNNNAGYTCVKITGENLDTEVQRLTPKYDDIIIDAGGRDTQSQRSAITVADIMLIPFVPRSFDTWTLDKVSLLVQDMRPANPNLTALSFINRADPSGQDNIECAGILKDSKDITFLDTPLGTRKAFSNAAAEGKSVCELNLRGDKAQADGEMRALYRYVFDINKI